MPWIVAIIIVAAYFISDFSALSSFKFHDVVFAAPISGTIDTISIPEKNIPVQQNTKAPRVAASTYAAYDEASNFALVTSRADEVRSIASITKLMTALVVLDHNPDWAKEITITRADYREGGRIHIYPGDVVTVEDLFRLGLIASDNVAITALVRSTDLNEEEFVTEMNTKARELRLKHASFADPTGLNPDNRASAHDVARLAAAAFKEEIIRETVTRTSYTFTTKNGDTKTAESTDKLLEADLHDGIELVAGKTGYLEDAGFCFVGLFEKDGHIITTVVLGAETEAARFEETKKLAEWVFSTYKW